MVTPPHLIVKNPEKINEMMEIKDSKNFRILGTNFQPNMGWKLHLENGTKAVLPEIRRKLGSLRKLGKQIPFKSRKFIAEGLLIGKLQYLITQWGGANQSLMTAVQRTQNSIARWVTGGNRKTRIRKLLLECGWLSVREMSFYHSVVQLWKIFTFKKPENMFKKIQIDENLDANTSTPRLQFTTYGYRWRSVENWNQIPREIREVKSLPSFKRKLRLWIVSKRNWDPD